MPTLRRDDWIVAGSGGAVVEVEEGGKGGSLSVL